MYFVILVAVIPVLYYVYKKFWRRETREPFSSVGRDNLITKFSSQYQIFGMTHKQIEHIDTLIIQFFRIVNVIVIENEKRLACSETMLAEHYLILERYRALRIDPNSLLFEYWKLQDNEKTTNRLLRLVLDPRNDNEIFRFDYPETIDDISPQSIDRVPLLKQLYELDDPNSFVHISKLMSMFVNEPDTIRFNYFKRAWIDRKKLALNKHLFTDRFVMIESLLDYDFALYLELLKSGKFRFLVDWDLPTVSLMVSKRLLSGLNFGLAIHLLNDHEHNFNRLASQTTDHLHILINFYQCCRSKLVYNNCTNSWICFCRRLDELHKYRLKSQVFSLFDLFVCKKRFLLSEYCDEFRALIAGTRSIHEFIRQFLWIRYAEISGLHLMLETIDSIEFPVYLQRELFVYFSNFDLLYVYFNCRNSFLEVYQ